MVKPEKERIILGFDPGSQVTGFGVVAEGRKLRLIEVGVVRLRRGESLELRLRTIHEKALELIARHQPDVIAVEDPFVGKSAASALVLGQARGVLLLAASLRDIPVTSYSPRAIKASVAGRGSASKEQVRFMVQALLGLRTPPEPLDASDALAVALCHASRGAVAVAGGSREAVDLARFVNDPKDLEAVQRWKQGRRGK